MFFVLYWLIRYLYERRKGTSSGSEDIAFLNSLKVLSPGMRYRMIASTILGDIVEGFFNGFLMVLFFGGFLIGAGASIWILGKVAVWLFRLLT